VFRSRPTTGSEFLGAVHLEGYGCRCSITLVSQRKKIKTHEAQTRKTQTTNNKKKKSTNLTGVKACLFFVGVTALIHTGLPIRKQAT